MHPSDDTAAARIPALSDDPFGDYRGPLEEAAERAIDYLEGLPARGIPADTEATGALQSVFGGDLPEAGVDANEVIRELAESAEPGLMAMNSPRFYGFVIGGTLPAALAADWLTSAWDQNAAYFATTPSAALAETASVRWLRDLFGLDPATEAGFVTGATVANLVCLAAARHEVLRREGWDVEAHGLQGAPHVTVVFGAEAHPSLVNSLRMLGLGHADAIHVAVDEQGRMRSDELERAIQGLTGPTIVAAQAGNVNTGAFDPLAEIVDAVRRLPNAWLHVDGAFGLWAAASPRLRPLVDGIAAADSVATDAHKWLNTPYDTGLAFVRNPAPLRAAMTMSAAYLPTGSERDPADFVPELSRRARGFPVYAALRSLGRSGVTLLVERCCDLAALIASKLTADPDVRILNDVVLNQVLVRVFDDDERTRELIRRVQGDGTSWAGPTVWHGMTAMRISVSGWSTSEADALRTVDTILAAVREVRAS